MSASPSIDRVEPSIHRTLLVRLFPLIAAGSPLLTQLLLTLITGSRSGERGLGQLTIVASVGSVIALVGDLGVGSGLVRLGRPVISRDRSAYVWSTRLVTVLGVTTVVAATFAATVLLPVRLGSVTGSQLFVSVVSGALLLVAAQELMLASVLAGPSAWSGLVLLRAFLGGASYLVAFLGFGLSPYVAYLLSAVASVMFILPLSAAVLRVGRPKVRRGIVSKIVRDGCRLTIGTVVGAGSVMAAPLVIVAYTDIELVGSLRALMLISGGISALTANYLAGVYFPRLSGSAEDPAGNAALKSTFRIVAAAAGTLVVVPYSAVVLKRLGLSVVVGQRTAWTLIIVSDMVRMASAVFAYFVLVRKGIRAFVVREVTNGVVFLALVAIAAKQHRLSYIAGAYAVAAVATCTFYALTAWRLLGHDDRVELRRMLLLFVPLVVSSLLVAVSPVALLLSAALIVRLLAGHPAAKAVRLRLARR